MKHRFAALVVLSVVGLTLSARAAEASLDPATADADARALIKENGYAFCTKPDDPLSPAAREMCPLAGEIPGCGALVEACGKVEEPLKLGPFLEAIAKFLARAAPYVAWALIAALVGGVGVLIVRALRAARDHVLPADKIEAGDVTAVPDPAVPDTLTAAEVLLRRAAEARSRGDGRTALVTYLAAALRALDDRGAIRLSRDRTNGEYVRTCQETAARAGLRDLVRDVDSVQFGGADASAEAMLLAESRAERIVHSRSGEPSSSLPPLMLLSLALLFAMVGACKGLDGLSRDDPAGRGLLVDLLRKQGAVISSVPGSLAHLPMNGTKGAVVVLDADHVPLEAETRAHLVAWVNQGGALVLAGNPSLWPSDFWAKQASGCDAATSTCDGGPTAEGSVTKVKVETRDRPRVIGGGDEEEDDDDDDVPVRRTSPAHVNHAMLSRRAAMTWPNENRAPRAIARLDSGDLYAALRTFGRGKVLGLASGDLLSNVGLAVPGNAASVIAMLAALDRHEFAVARAEQGIAPPDNPFAGLVHVGLGPALAHAALFIPLLFFAYGVRQAAPRTEPPARRRAFAEHVQAVGGLYARRRAAGHALAVYAKHVDDRVRAAMGRGSDPVEFLASRSGARRADAAEVYARGIAARAGLPPEGDELRVLQRLSAMYAKAVEKA